MIINAKLQVLFMTTIAYIYFKYIFMCSGFSWRSYQTGVSQWKGHHILCVSNAITLSYNCLHSSINLCTHPSVQSFIYSSIHYPFIQLHTNNLFINNISLSSYWIWEHLHSHDVHILIYQYKYLHRCISNISTCINGVLYCP